jgi:uncharacterized BrkB/YihY/UPF0761 family membrane protein
MNDFSYTTALTIFFTYVAIDMLYAWYIMSVNKKRAFTAAILTAIIYSLLAFGVVSYSKNIYYLIPLASGAFLGTYLMVKFKE